MSMMRGSRLVVPAIVIALLLPTALSLTSTAAAPGDLHVTSVIVVQVVPEPRGVVVNKSAAICVTVVSAFIEEVYANISVTYNHGSSSYVEMGPEGRGIPLAPGANTVFVPGGNCTSHPQPWTSEPATFIWTEPGLDSSVIAEVDPDDSVTETDETNNQMVTDPPIDVWASRDLRILVVPVYCSSSSLSYGHEPPEFSLDEELQELLDTYPLADDGVEIVEAPPRDERYDPMSWVDCARVTESLSAEARILGYDRVVAVFEKIRDSWGRETYGSAVGCLDEPRDPVPLFITADGIDIREALLAHELGHTYYLWHPHDIGIPVYGATKWSVSESVYGMSANTWMSNPGRLPSGVPVTPRWIDNERYQDHERSYIDLTSFSSGPNGTWEWNLFSQLVNAPRTLGPIVVIEGSILRSGAAIITCPWFTVPLGVPEEQLIPQQGPVGSYSVRMLDLSRNILGSTYFNVSFSRLMHDDGEDESYYLDGVDSVDFVVNAPNLPSTRYVQILDPLEAVLAERVVTTSAPTVEILSPNGAENIDIGQSPEISWTADDLDGDDLSYLISYTPDDGDTWIPVASNLTASSYTWNTTGVAPTEKCRIRVMASDGFNTGEDGSDAVFRMSDSIPPTTRIELNGTLGQNSWYVSGVDVSLFASDNSRVSRTEYSLDNSTWAIYKSSFRLLNEGANALSFRSTDLAGNVEPVRSATVMIDLTAPSLSIISPSNGSSVDEDVVFTWAAADTISGVVRYEVRLDSGAWMDVAGAQRWESAGLAEGAHTFEVRATDAAGNDASTSVDFSYRESSGIALWILALVAGTIVAIGAVLGAYHWRKGKG